MKASWISRHPHVVIGCLLVACLGPFLNKAIHADDPLFIWTAQWIQHHPADFFGFKVNWWYSAIPMWVTNCNPPLMSYCLAGAGSLFGWSEVVLHLAGLAIAFAAATGIYSLARLWCDRPLLATVVAIFTPVFLVSSTTLMCDVLMLAFWVWALVFWERALAGGRGGWQFAGAGALAGLAVLTKYSAMTLLPLLPILSLLRMRRAGWWLLGLAVPLIMVAGYELMTARMYGIGGLAGAAEYARTHRVLFAGDWMANGIIGLAFAGGSLLPLLCYAPLAWRWPALLAGGAVMVGGLAAALRPGGIELPGADPAAMSHWGYPLQVALLAAGGLHLLALAGAETGQKRDATSAVLILWILSGFFFALALNWTVSARNFLPVAPAAAILLVRRLRTMAGTFRENVRSWCPLLPAAAIALNLAVADQRLANTARTAAGQIAEKYRPAGHRLWFEGHWGFQYYMEKLRGQPIDCEQTRLEPGDMVAVPLNCSNLIPLPAGSVGWIGHLQYMPAAWVNPSVGSASSAGVFYSAFLGPVPFAVGGIPSHIYCVVKVFSPVQYQTQLSNPRAVRTGAVPVYLKLAVTAEEPLSFQGTAAAEKDMQLAGQLEKDGAVETAIAVYRRILEADANNPLALNNLAWLLAAADKPGLRNGPEAVRLAARAVELTDRRMAVFIGTLAAAQAEAGQFSEAVQTAGIAQQLAGITGQLDVAAANLKLSGRYAAGKTAMMAEASGPPVK